MSQSSLASGRCQRYGARKAAEDAGTARLFNGGSNEDPTHEAGKSPPREAQEKAGMMPSPATPGTSTTPITPTKPITTTP